MTSQVLKLSPSETYEFATAALQCRQVPYIAGPPAIGKSQVVHQIAEDANAKMIDLRLSQMLSEDMTGLPERDEKRGKAVYLPFDTFPLEGDPIPDGYSGWLLFLDELSSATEEVLAAAYSIILDRMVGGRKLHDKCIVVAAGNRASDSAIARELPDTLITRMLPIEMRTNVKDWIRWACRPETPSNEAVVDYIQKNTKMLYAPTKAKERDELEPYPTPRGWEKVFAHVNMHEKENSQVKERVDAAGVPTGEMETVGKALSPMTFHLIAAAVGPMAARDFKDTYDENIALPTPWEIAQAPASARVPSAGVAKARLMQDISKHFIESGDQTRDNLLIYINRIGGEYSELFVSNLKEKLGDKPTDKRMIQEVSERLNIDPLLGGTTGGGSNNSPF